MDIGLKKSVLIIGLGDLGRRIALRMAGDRHVGELILVGRAAERDHRRVELVRACSDIRVTYRETDVEDVDDLERVLRETWPDVVVQCAAVVSPWALHGRKDETAMAMRRAGFAVFAPAQLVAIRNLMRAVEEAGYSGPVVNCSYPDVTHPVLASRGLAPTLGIGNVSMVAAKIRGVLRAHRREFDILRVVGHHAQLTACMSSEPLEESMRPAVFVDGEREDDLAFEGAAMPAGQIQNELTARTAADAISALVGEEARRMSLPGPLGLPGGYPVVVTAAAVLPDLPDGVDLGTARSWNERFATMDGVDAISGAGRLRFSEVAKTALAEVAPELVDDLEFEAIDERAALLKDVLRRSR